jgi:hypothetical protein
MSELLEGWLLRVRGMWVHQRPGELVREPLAWEKRLCWFGMDLVVRMRVRLECFERERL